MNTVNVLFLDDMKTRHSSFRRVVESMSALDVHYVHSADEAIAALASTKFDQVFLDHDLSEEDIMCAPGAANATVPTGMAVVDHILTMPEPPVEIIVHSCNGPASDEMCARLRTLSGVKVRQLPFPTLLGMLK